MSGSRPSIRNIVLELARESEGSFGAKDVVVLAGCTTGSAQIALSQLAAEGRLQRVARGFYARPGVFSKPDLAGSGEVTMARGLSNLAERDLAAADAWLADKPPLPAARPPLAETPRARVRK